MAASIGAVRRAPRPRWCACLPSALLALSLASTAAAAGPFHARAFGGDVDLDRAPEGAEITSFGGNVHIRSAGERVHAIAFGGNVRLDALDGSARVTTFGGDVHVAVTGPCARGRELALKSFGGNVWLTLPADFSAAIDVELECQRHGDEACRIASDVPLTEEYGPWHRSLFVFGPSRRTLHAWTKLGDGANRVRIHVHGGTVNLVREGVVHGTR